MGINFLLESIKLLNFIAVFQTLLIATYLFLQKKGNAVSRQVLAMLLIDSAIFLTGTYLLLFSGNKTTWGFAHLANLTVFLATPLLYFYFSSLIIKEFKLNANMFIHGIPFFLAFLIMTYELVIQSNHQFVFRPYGISLLFVLYLQNIFYLIQVYKLKQKVDLQKTNPQGPKWFDFIFRSLILVFGLKLIIFIFWNVLGWVDVCVFFTGLFFILSFILINMLVLFGLFNPNMLIHHVKYQNTPIDKIIHVNCYNELLNCLSEEQLYKDSLLSLQKLAKRLNVPAKHLSQIINENSGDNFNEFINKYRIREAQRLLTQSTEKYNILQIAYEVGFNSKSTFNTTFKKHTGTTPSWYRKKSNTEA